MTENSPRPIPPPCVLTCGEPGTGKTTALATIAHDMDLFVIVTDPRGEESLIDGITLHDVDINRVHWHYIAPAAPSWDTLLEMAQKINRMSYEDLTKIKAGVNKPDYRQFEQLLSCLADFTCDRTGQSYGPADGWSSNRCLAIDSLTGINTMALTLMIGAKPVAHQGEWGCAMTAEERLLQKLCSDLSCMFALTAHVELEKDELSGGTKQMVAALGRRLAPKIPREFSDVIHTYREGSNFYWSTISPGVVTKARSLPLSDKMAPDYTAIISRWRGRLLAMQEEPAVSTPL